MPIERTKIDANTVAIVVKDKDDNVIAAGSVVRTRKQLSDQIASLQKQLVVQKDNLDKANAARVKDLQESLDFLDA